MDGGQAGLEAAFHAQRRKAALVLLTVTLVWGATFIWMKQALNALEVEIETFGTFSVVAYLVALRFLLAMVLVAVFFRAQASKLVSAACKSPKVLAAAASSIAVLTDTSPLGGGAAGDTAIGGSAFDARAAIEASWVGGTMP